MLTIAGNSVGVVTWALLSIAGISALVAASEVAFVALKVVGAAVLVYLGVQSLRRASAPAEPPSPREQRAFRDGVVTSLANPKLAVFFVALFPQFVGADGNVLADDAADGGDDRRAATSSGTARSRCWRAARRPASCAAARVAGSSARPAAC